MRFFRKSLLRKFVLFLLYVIVMIAAFAWYSFDGGKEILSYRFFIGSLLFLFIVFVVFYYYEIIRPIRKILLEIQCLLTAKPYKKIYTSRIDEFSVIAYFFNKVTEGFGEVSSDIKDRQRMISELSVASELQRDILPVNATSDICGLEVVAKNKPASELGGDSYNFFTIKGKTYIYIGDVTGHGAAAGLIMTMVNSLISVFSDIYDNPYDILVNVNKYIKRHVKKSMFMTLVMLCWDCEAQKMTYVGAGHEHILIYRVESGKCDSIMSGGVALGMVPDNSAVIHEKSLDLSNGDFIVLYSDGVTEAKNIKGELFGLERLQNLIVEYAPDHSPEGLNYKIAQELTEYMNGHGQDDDITLIVIKRDDQFVADGR